MLSSTEKIRNSSLFHHLKGVIVCKSETDHLISSYFLPSGAAIPCPPLVEIISCDLIDRTFWDLLILQAITFHQPQS